LRLKVLKKLRTASLKPEFTGFYVKNIIKPWYLKSFFKSFENLRLKVTVNVTIN